MKTQEVEKQFLTIDEMAARYDVGKRTIQMWIHAGVLTKYFKVRHVIRFDAKACDEELFGRCD